MKAGSWTRKAVAPPTILYESLWPELPVCLLVGHLTWMDGITMLSRCS